MKHLILVAVLSSFLVGCHASAPDDDAQKFDIQDAASSWRHKAPQGDVPIERLTQSMKITLGNRFPIWRDSIAAAVDVSIINISDSHLPARGTASLYIYSFDEKQPLYWANIDIAYGESTGPGTKNVLSLPVGTSKDITIPILATTWGNVHTKIWPDAPFYTIIPTGKYLMRFEFEIYDEDDNPVGIAVSNFIQFSTIQTSPETIIPKDDKT
ncbi:MAG: hypothetical protein IJM59_06385 [Proteobacteria bacterium]|nr:hypothetical protein [Pseudomonadota bacterium]